MKVILISVMALSLNAQAGGKPTPVKRQTASSTSRVACIAKMEKAVHDAATAMGLKIKIGVQFIDIDTATKDTQGHALTSFSTGMFITEEGYLSNSGANVVVRETATSCDLLKLSVSIGG